MSFPKRNNKLLAKFVATNKNLVETKALIKQLERQRKEKFHSLQKAVKSGASTGDPNLDARIKENMSSALAGLRIMNIIDRW